jgi:alpha-aminoadipate/glutamate carrier protein LysW
MVNCPNCEAVIDVDEEDLDEGDTISCDECGADLTVTGLDPLDVELTEDEDEEEADEDFDYDEDEDEKEEEEDEEDWK